MITDTIYTENSIRTFTGKVFDLKILDPDSICIEDKLMKVIAQKFGFDYPLNPEIKKIDGDFLNLEWNAFVENNDSSFPLYSPEEAEKQFLAMFEFLVE